MAKITDPLLHPYFVGKDTHCYTVYEIVKPQGHYSSFGAALQKIAKEKLHNEKDHYTSIKQYVERWEELLTELKKLQNYKGL